MAELKIYDFNRKIERRGTHSLKWDDLKTHFGDDKLMPFWVADMDFETAPEIKEALSERIEHGIFGYVCTPNSLNELAVSWTKRRYSYEMDPEKLIFSPGVVPSLAMIVRDLTAPSDKIIIQTPVYGPFSASTKNYGRTLVTNPLIEKEGRYTIDFQDFDVKTADPDVKWFILCNPHNPVGRVWTREELERLGEICLKNSVRVISDEIWRDLVFEGHQHISFAGLSKAIENITITLFSVTKTFNLAGIQASFAYFPNEEEGKLFKKAFELIDLYRHNPFNLVAMEAALSKGEPWLQALLEYLKDNVDYVVRYLEENLPEVKCQRPEGTYLLWLDFKALGLDQRALMGHLQKKGRLALNDGFWFGREGIGYARMNIACPKESLEEAMAMLQEAVEALRHS